MRTSFIRALTERAEHDESIFLVTPDMGFSVLEKYIERYTDRYLNVGIAEQNAIGVAAGLALSGYNVYVYSIVPFVTMRCFEQVRVDVAYMNTNVKLIGVGGGFSYGPAGATHHALEDISLMRTLPNMTVCCPGDPFEVAELVTQSFERRGPMYIRLGKNNEPVIHPLSDIITLGKASVLREGRDFALLTTGNMLEQGSRWVKEWVSEGFDPMLVSMHTIKPLDRTIIREIAATGMKIVSLEEHYVVGGLGSAVAEVLSAMKTDSRLVSLGVEDEFSHFVGSHESLRKHFGLQSKPEGRSLMES